MNRAAIVDFYRTQLGVNKENTIKLLADNTKFRKRKKGEQMLRAGDPMTVAIVPLSGVARSYVVNDEGYEVVTGFIASPEVLCMGASGIQEKITLNVDAVTDMDTLEVPISILLYAIRQDPDCAAIYHRRLIRYHDSFQEWQIARQTKKGKAMYQWFLKKYKDIANYVPQKDIASYLGIQPPSLSRLKADLEKGK